MKNLLVLTNSEHAYQGAGGRTRIVSEIKQLQQLPLNISLLCIVPLKKFLNLNRIIKARQKLIEDTKVHVYVIPSIPISHFITLAKLSHYINAFFILLFSKIKIIKTIHAHGNVIAYSAVLSKKMGNKAQVITDSHGSVAEEYKYATPHFNKSWMNWLERIEKYVLEKSDHIIFVSESMRQFYSKKFGINCSNASIIACASNPISKIPLEQRNIKRIELNISDKIVFVYLGSFRKYQMVNETLDLFKALKQNLDNAYLLIITSHQSEFSEAIKQKDINSKDYTMLSAKQSDVPDLLVAADIGFLLRDQSLVNEVASPTKYAEYLMSGVPVILTNNIGDYSAFTTENKTGFVIDDFHSSDALIEFVQAVSFNREHYYNHCYSKAIEQLSWNYAGNTLRNLYA